jgi:hypothetical protein
VQNAFHMAQWDGYVRLGVLSCGCRVRMACYPVETVQSLIRQEPSGTHFTSDRLQLANVSG